MAEKRRILHKLKINEISCVDSPAQEHARMIIMKRADIEKDATSAGNIEGALHVDGYLGTRRKKRLSRRLARLQTSISGLTKASVDHGRFSVRAGGGGTIADVPFMITEEMKVGLRALGYTDNHIRNMAPALAAELLNNPIV